MAGIMIRLMTSERSGRERLLVAAPALVGSQRIGVPEDVAALDPFEGGRIVLTSKDGGTHMLTPSVALSTNNIFALHRAALMGAGFAVLPCCRAAALVRRW